MVVRDDWIGAVSRLEPCRPGPEAGPPRVRRISVRACGGHPIRPRLPVGRPARPTRPAPPAAGRVPTGTAPPAVARMGGRRRATRRLLRRGPTRLARTDGSLIRADRSIRSTSLPFDQVAFHGPPREADRVRTRLDRVAPRTDRSFRLGRGRNRTTPGAFAAKPAAGRCRAPNTSGTVARSLTLAAQLGPAGSAVVRAGTPAADRIRGPGSGSAGSGARGPRRCRSGRTRAPPRAT